MNSNNCGEIEFPIGCYDDTKLYHNTQTSTTTALPHYLLPSETIYPFQPTLMEAIQEIAISREEVSSPTNVRCNILNKDPRVTDILLDLGQEDDNDSSFFLMTPSKVERQDDNDQYVIQSDGSSSVPRESRTTPERKRSCQSFHESSLQEPRPKPQVKRFSLLPRRINSQIDF